MKPISLLGVPVQEGASQKGCIMGPDALRTANLAHSLEALGYTVTDFGNVVPDELIMKPAKNSNIHDLDYVAGWISGLQATIPKIAHNSIPIFMGGDHSLAAGTVSAMSDIARDEGKPLFVLWLDAHSDFHTLDTTESGNLHGTPVAYYTGQSGFEGHFPPLRTPVPPERICMMGLRSVDHPEAQRLMQHKFILNDMRAIDEHGIGRLIRAFLDQVKAANGVLHVSLDVDFLDPEIAPAVGTTVPGGASFREAHLIMEMLHESQLLRSLDLVELNPFLDHKGRTAKLLVDLTASLFGRKIIDRETRSF